MAAPATNTPKPANTQHNFEKASSSAQDGGNTVSQELSGITQGVTQEVTNLVKNTLPDMLRNLLGQPTSMDLDPSKAQERQSDAEYWRKRFQMSEQQRQEEKALFQERQQQQEMRIVQVRDQIQSLSGSITKFNHEIEMTTFNVRAENSSDVYTENFFAQLLSFVLQLQNRVNKASHWLATQNQRASKKGPFFMKGNNMQVDAFQSGERSSAFGG